MRAHLMNGQGEPGARLGRYLVLRHLASGGMADVLLGRSDAIEGFERHVVLKRIRADFAHDRRFIRMFLDEARVAATLHHQHIVQVYDVGESNGEYFIAMEYIHGQDVRQILAAAARQRIHVPLGQAIAIVSAAAAGLHYAHERLGSDMQPLNIVHRDISLSNILVGYDGSTKVVDFGVATASMFQETRSRNLSGKVPYMSPEQCLCDHVDRRSDVYSLGVVLYELATTTRMIKGDSDFVSMEQIVHGRIASPETRRPDLPGELVAIILRAIATDRDQRYASADELRMALDQFASSAALTTPPSAIAAYMREVFGPRLEPWLELDRKVTAPDDEVPTVSVGPGEPGEPGEPGSSSWSEPASDGEPQASERRIVPRASQPAIPAGQSVARASQPVFPAGQSVARASQPVFPAGQSVARASQPVLPAGQSVARASQPVLPAGQSLAHASQPVLSAGQSLAHASQPVLSAGQSLAHASQPVLPPWQSIPVAADTPSSEPAPGPSRSRRVALTAVPLLVIAAVTVGWLGRGHRRPVPRPANAGSSAPAAPPALAHDPGTETGRSPVADDRAPAESAPAASPEAASPPAASPPAASPESAPPESALADKSPPEPRPSADSRAPHVATPQRTATTRFDRPSRTRKPPREASAEAALHPSPAAGPSPSMAATAIPSPSALAAAPEQPVAAPAPDARPAPAAATPPASSPSQAPGMTAAAPARRVVIAAVLEANRTAGERDIPPDEASRAEIRRSGRNATVGVYKICLAADGSVNTVSVIKSTGYPAYDAKIESTIFASWRYRPILVDGRPGPVCSGARISWATTTRLGNKPTWE